MTSITRLAVGGLAALCIAAPAAYLLPATVRVERTIEVDAPPSLALALAGSPERMRRWTDWPSGLAGGEVVALAEAVRYRLGPDAQLALSARAANGTTRLGWSVELDLGADPVGRYAGLAADRLLGPRLEAGLARLARLVERLPPHDVSALDVERHVLAPRPLLRVERPLLDGARPTADAVTSALAAVAVALDGLGERPAGPPVLLWNGSTLSIGVPVTGFGDRATSALPGRVSSGSLPGGEAVRAVHVGPYETLLETHGAVAAWLAVHGLGAGGPQWLVFRDDPAATPREVLRTELWYSLE